VWRAGLLLQRLSKGTTQHEERHVDLILHQFDSQHPTLPSSIVFTVTRIYPFVCHLCTNGIGASFPRVPLCFAAVETHHHLAIILFLSIVLKGLIYLFISRISARFTLPLHAPLGHCDATCTRTRTCTRIHTRTRTCTRTHNRAGPLAKAPRDTMPINRSIMDDLPNYSYYDRATQESNIASGTTLGGRPVTNLSQVWTFRVFTMAVLILAVFCTLYSEIELARWNAES
jgi:hypothetical protein